MSQPGPPSAGAEVAPTCYRHPNRETYIRCSRCGRAICPDCMISAPVGFQCPICVKEGAASVPAARTAVGGTLRGGGSPVTLGLMVANAAVFLLAQADGSRLVASLALIRGPLAFAGLGGVADGEYYRLLTSAFLHTNLLHIAFNMWALWVLGGMLEPLLGRVRYLTLYMVSALGGGAASYAFLPGNVVAYGASGAVFGLLGGTYVVLRRLNRETSTVTVLVGINVVIGFVIPGIDWRAHLGGLVTGAVVAAGFAYAPRARRTPVAVATVLATLVVIAAVVMWRTVLLT